MNPINESLNLPSVDQATTASPEQSSQMPSIATEQAPANQTTASPASNLPAMPLAKPAASPVPVPTSSQTASSATSMPVDDDQDLIEKEWVNKAKQIVEKTRDDPFKQSEELTAVKADYLQTHYNKTIKMSK